MHYIPRAEDAVVGLWGDRVVLADEVSDGLQQLHDVRPLVAVRYRGVVPETHRVDGHSAALHAKSVFAGVEKCFKGSFLLSAGAKNG